MDYLKKLLVSSIVLIASTTSLHAKSDADIENIDIKEIENIVIDNYNRLDYLEKITNELIRKIVRIENLIEHLQIEEVEI